MGHHFVPQAYLRAFEDPAKPGFIWVQPRRGGVGARRASIDDVAQSSDYYDGQVEVELAQHVEAPANPVLSKLRNGDQITPEERYHIALYLAVMIKRVPRSRERAQALIQPALESTVAELRQQINERGRLDLLPASKVEMHLRELDEAFAKFSKEPPEGVTAQIRDPKPTEEMVKAVYAMHWRVLVAAAPEFFVTSDNPAYYDTGYGVASAESELRFPLSPTHALHCTQIPNRLGPLSYHAAARDWVREFNRSIAADATSIAMSHRYAPWLATLIRRKKPYLSRLLWTDL